MTLQVGEKDMILPPDPGFKRASSGEDWAVDVFTPEPAKPASVLEQKITPLSKPGKEGSK